MTYQQQENRENEEKKINYDGQVLKRFIESRDLKYSTASSMSNITQPTSTSVAVIRSYVIDGSVMVEVIVAVVALRLLRVLAEGDGDGDAAG